MGDARDCDATSNLKRRFSDVVTNLDEVRAVVGEPQERSVLKVIQTIDDHARRYIAHSPFLLMASAAADGPMDVSPRGDPSGFVKVLDDKTLAIPDRPGNKRIDTFRNILTNPRVGLIFLVPGVTYTLRVSGTAIIVRDHALREALAVNGNVLNTC